MKREVGKPRHGCRIILIFAVVLSVLMLSVGLVVGYHVPDGVYCEEMIRQAGLHDYRRIFSIEQVFCEDSAFDAKVFLMAKLDERYRGEIVNKMKSFNSEKSEIELGTTPSWWNPMPQAEMIAYYVDPQSASPVVLAYVETINGETYVYLAIIPV